MSRDTVGCHIRGVLLSASGYRLGVLLHILQCKGLLPMTKNYSAQNVSSAKAEKPQEVIYFD